MFIKLTSNIDGKPYLFPKASIAVSVDSEGQVAILPINGDCNNLEFGVTETFEEVEAMLMPEITSGD